MTFSLPSTSLLLQLHTDTALRTANWPQLNMTNHMTRHGRSALYIIFNTHISIQSCNRRSTIDIRRSPRQHFLKKLSGEGTFSKSGRMKETCKQTNLEEYENDVFDQRLSQFQLSIQKFSNFALYVAEIALVAARLGQFQQLLKHA